MIPVERLAERIDARTAVIAIVGMGYVGLPLMLAATGAGFRVLGFDIDRPKVVNLNRGRSPLRHVGDEPIRRVVESGRFEATAEPARLGEADAILICVPTPIGRHREPDLSFVEGTAETILPHLRAGCLVVLESTTWPGTTRELLRPILERGGLASEETLFLAYSPEREDPGNADFNTSRIPKVVGGDGPKALAIATRLYAAIVEKVVPVSSAATAEAVKLTENIFRAVNIALVNELKLAFEPMGIDIFEVIDAAGTKPFGFMPFYPGPGLGGHCIPIDPFYLTWKAR
ncbi:MAG: nucleotide sugar dehydrogenase, partial [Geminicoccaceae bacterium]|nr:nucleotide sugar dehydrogenase [Geminicoccaceae bacterium]